MKTQSIYKRVLLLAVPMMIQSGITNAVTLVDNLMVGSLGTEAITAVSIGGQLIFVFNLAIFGAVSGPGIYGAQFFGKGDEAGFRDSFRIKVVINLLCLVAGVLILGLGAEGLIGLYLHGESASVDVALVSLYAKQYLRIMLLGLPAFVVTQVLASSLREMSESMQPMVAGICSVMVDVVFNYLLIYGKLGFPALGVRGAAIATVLSRFVEVGVLLTFVLRRRARYGFLAGLVRRLSIPKTMRVQVIRKSIPLFLNEFFWAGGMAALTTCYSLRGVEIVAGLNISNAICNLLNVVFIAMGQAVGVIVGQMLGAQKFKQAKSDAVRLMLFSTAITVGLSLGLILLSGVIPELYSTTAQVKQYAKVFIMITALFFPVSAFLNALYFTIRSGGKTLITFGFDSVFNWCISVPVAYVLCASFGSISIFVVYATVLTLDFIKIFIGCVIFKKGLWISNVVS